ncbi:unnamed protein product, partial [Amoebophrya sp. A25]
STARSPVKIKLLRGLSGDSELSSSLQLDSEQGTVWNLLNAVANEVSKNEEWLFVEESSRGAAAVPVTVNKKNDANGNNCCGRDRCDVTVLLRLPPHPHPQLATDIHPQPSCAAHPSSAVSSSTKASSSTTIF